MTRYVAFLRAINAGVPAQMSVLRQRFEGLGFDEVRTFINSGNVLFSTRAADRAKLEARIERDLGTTLGAPVPAFVRTDDEVVALAELEPFDDVGTGTLQVAFLKEPPPASARRAVAALSNDTDRLQVTGRELWWHTRGGIMDSTVKAKALDAALGGAVLTARNVNTVRRIAAKLV